MEDLFFEVQQLVAQNMPELVQVDEDYGQLDVEEGMPYDVSFPCVLIGMPLTTWQTKADAYQQGEMDITVKLCIDCSDIPLDNDEAADKVAERMGMHRKLEELLHNFTPQDGEEGFERRASRFYSLPKKVKVYETTFTYLLEEEYI